MSPFVTLPFAVLLAAVPVAAGTLRSLGGLSDGRWLSLGGGISVAYVFVHVLPEITERHARLVGDGSHGTTLAAAASHHAIFLAALAGFTAFYGLERLVRRGRGTGDGESVFGRGETLASRRIFWVHVGSFAAYNALVGYLLLHRETAGVASFAFYLTAMAVHFVVNDAGLREHHRSAYDRVGKWVLAGAVLVGVAFGVAIDVPESVVSGLFAALGGAIVFNVVKEELPDARDSRFSTFAVGVCAYAVALLLV